MKLFVLLQRHRFKVKSEKEKVKSRSGIPARQTVGSRVGSLTHQQRVINDINRIFKIFTE